MERFLDRIRRVRAIGGTLLGRDVYYRPETRVRYRLFGGSDHGRFGAWAVDADRIRSDSIVYSVGVGDDISFDLALIRGFGVTIHAFDPTPASHAWLETQGPPSEFVLHKLALGDRDGTAHFFPHENPEYVAHSLIHDAHTRDDAIEVPVRRLETIAHDLGHDHIDLLKLDIEGAEYGVIDDLLAHDLRPTQLLVEFHHRFESIGLDSTRAAMNDLRRAGYRVFYVSPRAEEYSLLFDPDGAHL